MISERAFIGHDVYPPGVDYLSFDGGASYASSKVINDITGQLTSWEIRNSTSHPGFRKALGSGDVGGSFLHTKKGYSEEGTGPYHLANSYWGYRGHIRPYGGAGYPSWWTNTSISSSTDLLFALGGTAVSRSIPTNPVGSAAVFLGELREEFPHIVGKSLLKSIVKEHRLRAATLGDEYLNIEFGWKPFIADLTKFARGVVNHDKIMTQLVRNSGRNVKRRYNFPLSETSTVPFEQFNNACIVEQNGDAFAGPIYGGPGHVVMTETVSTNRWFSGCFTYHLPDYNEMFGVKRYVAEANKLLGTSLTPEVVWQLAPWSWAADWVANTGDVMRNLTEFSQNDLAMRYGYLMETKRRSATIVADQVLWLRDGYPFNARPSLTFYLESKLRIPASPFGFGLTWDSFTPRQIAIAGALGISRH